MTSANDKFRQIRSTLSAALNNEAEGEGAARIIMEDLAGYDRKKLWIDGDRTLLDETEARIDKVVAAIVAGAPVQYAVGTARFCGHDYLVTPAVLIPRPETEALVDMIVRDADGRPDLHVLDVGTGSGCIAIELARALPFARVEAIDISEDALAIARQNAVRLRVKVDFRKDDALALTPPVKPCYDVIVSNPPYIADGERADMDARVINNEPAGALFVPDDDPLRFYTAIARYAAKALVPGGRLYFEINSRYPQQMRALLADLGFKDVDVLRDFRGNYRFATATL